MMSGFDMSDFVNYARRVVAFASFPAMKIASDVVTADMMEKTARGVDADGARFKPYTERYKKVRKEKNLSTDLVDLRVSGAMLEGVRFIGNELVPGGDHAELVGYHTSGRKVRNFFSVGEDSTPRIEERVLKAFQNI